MHLASYAQVKKGLGYPQMPDNVWIWTWTKGSYQVFSYKRCSLCVRVCLITQSCPTLCNLMDCNPPVPSDYGIFQARILDGVVISFSRGSFPPRDWTCISSVSCIAGTFFTQACLWIRSKWKLVAFHNYIWPLGLSFLTRNQGKKGSNAQS